MKRIGFACKWINNITEINGVSKTSEARQYNTITTTATWLSKQTRSVSEDKLWEIIIHNINSLKLLTLQVNKLDKEQHMFRISSDILPLYTHKDWKYFYKQTDVKNYLNTELYKIGQLIKQLDIRVSFHPGPFVVLASDNPLIVQNSINEFEYHVDIARMLGFGNTFQDIKINVHISGKLGSSGIRNIYKNLSPEAQNLITIENDEITYGLDDCLKLGNIIPIVLDIHHHWCYTGEYIKITDPRIEQIINSWRGIRPVMHYSISKYELFNIDNLNSYEHRLPQYNKSKVHKLRAHGDFFWNNSVNDIVYQFWDKFDIMCESKAKNLSSNELYKYFLTKKNLNKTVL